LFIGGCAENMKQLFPLIEMVVLLSAPTQTLMERLESRPAGSYGNSADDRQRVRELISTVEPMLRRSAHHEIDTSGPVSATVDAILRLV
jgi:shikimate kinase